MTRICESIRGANARRRLHYDGAMPKLWLITAFFAAVGIAVIAARRSLAHALSMIAGGTVPPGCVIAEGVALIVVGALFLLLR